jgi:predicted nucleotidyltransferase
MKTILSGVVGSQAYGLATKDSDTDTMGVFVVPTTKILGLSPFKESVASKNVFDGDMVQHEVGKFITLCLKANPSVLEMLWLEDYLEVLPEGKYLLNYRKYFLSERVRLSYGGYARDQFKKLELRVAQGKESFSSNVRTRYSKHARHLFRLLEQGQQLLTTGSMSVRLENPEAIAALGELYPEELIRVFNERFKEFDSCKCVLPAKPDTEKVNEVLLAIRHLNY